jgi:hypothetical protein
VGNGRELNIRTKKFALRIMRLYEARAAGRARSKAEFIAKMGIVLEEGDESVFWLELKACPLRPKPLLPPDKVHLQTPALDGGTSAF